MRRHCLVGEPLTDVERDEVIALIERQARQAKTARSKAEIASLQALKDRDRDRGRPWPKLPR